MKKNCVIVFDLDDTLYKEVEYLKSAYKDIASWIERSYCAKGVYEYMLISYYEGLNVFQTLNKHYDLNVDIDEYLLRYRSHFPNIYLDSDVVNVLKELLIRDSTIGIITDGREMTQRNKIMALRLSDYISQKNYIISETFGYAKPSLEGYSYFSNKYGEADYYYVGDNVAKDFIAPNFLGWDTICLLDDGNNIHKQDFSESPEKLPNSVIKNITELLKLVK